MVILLWVLLRNPHSDSHISCNCMYCCQEQEGIRIPCQCLVIFVFLMMAFLTGVELNLKVVFIFIALVMRDDEYFKGCILAICMAFRTLHVVSSAHFYWVSCVWKALFPKSFPSPLTPAVFSPPLLQSSLRPEERDLMEISI